MSFDKLKLENIFSFKNSTVDLRGLNVLIGPNAVGKSNLIEAIALLQSTPNDLQTAILRQGGAHTVISLAESSPIAAIESHQTLAVGRLEYRLEFAELSQGYAIQRELVAVHAPNRRVLERLPGRFVSSIDFPALTGEPSIPPAQSIFAAYKHPADPTPITALGQLFSGIRIYRDFRTAGAMSAARHGISSSIPKDYLYDGADNLAAVLLELDFKGVHDRIRAYLQRFCDRFHDVKTRLDGSIAKTYIQEAGLLEPLPGTRLSDGTLKFLCILAVLLEPNRAPLICIEEPELGLHPDAVGIVAEALVEASHHTQLLITTHSEALVDALSDRPEDVMVAERDFDNGTQFGRLEKDQLSHWLKRYTLGRLWRKGEIGGNRW